MVGLYSNFSFGLDEQGNFRIYAAPNDEFFYHSHNLILDRYPNYSYSGLRTDCSYCSLRSGHSEEVDYYRNHRIYAIPTVNTRREKNSIIYSAPNLSTTIFMVNASVCGLSFSTCFSSRLQAFELLLSPLYISINIVLSFMEPLNQLI